MTLVQLFWRFLATYIAIPIIQKDAIAFSDVEWARNIVLKTLHDTQLIDEDFYLSDHNIAIGMGAEVQGHRNIVIGNHTGIPDGLTDCINIGGLCFDKTGKRIPIPILSGEYNV